MTGTNAETLRYEQQAQAETQRRDRLTKTIRLLKRLNVAVALQVLDFRG